MISRSIMLAFVLLLSGVPHLLQAQQWTKVSTPVDTTIVSILEHDGVLLIGTLGRGMYRSSDGGTTWLHVLDVPAADPRKESIRSIVPYGGYLIAAGLRRGPYRSSDNGLTWAKSDTLPGFISMDTLDSSIVAGTDGRRLFRSTDSGTSWLVIPDKKGLATQFLTVYHYGQYFYGGCGNGLFRTYDTGAFSWVLRPLGRSTAVNWIAVVRGTLFASSDSGMWRWNEEKDTMVRSGLEGVFIIDVEVIGDTMYAASYDRGIFVSRDAGSTWQTFNDGLGDTTVTELESIDGVLYAGTLSKGLWKSPGSGASSVKEREIPLLPSMLSSMRITPNPVTSSMALALHLTTPTSVTITIYDALGRIAAQPVTDLFRDAGEHQITVQTEGLAEGTYLCSMKAGGVEETVRFVVAR